jgi:negative regulator of sigma E activity
MKNRSRFGVLLAACLAAAVPAVTAWAEEPQDPRIVLRNMFINARKTGYEGKKVVIDFSKSVPDITRYHIVHVLPDRERRDYTDLGRVVIMKDGWLEQYYPKEGLVIRRKEPASNEWDVLQQENLDLVMKSYDVKLEPGAPMVGRRSLLVQLSPLDRASRPLRKIWIDQEKGLPLRGEVYGVDGNLYLLSHFELLRYNNPPGPGSFTIDNPRKIIEAGGDADEWRTTGSCPTSVASALWKPGMLPGGFMLKSLRRNTGTQRYQQLYTDGLSALSLFQEQGEQNLAERAGRVSKVAVGPASGLMYDLGLMRLVKWNRGGQHFVLVGELSSDNMLRVADSVALNKADKGANQK